jgi:NAD(P)H-flavin reductase
VKEVKDGNVSMQLKNSKLGTLVEVNGPFGSFKLETRDMNSRKHLFIATGTGISPFHSMVASYPEINYTLLHGIRYPDETYEKYDYDPKRYIPCISGGNGKNRGRVTDFLPFYRDEHDMMYYVCGNSDMIYDVCNILKNRGVTGDRVLTEIYF